ncbi:MAG TPA: hypothetical protein VLS89_01465 [Candidatus Nanopelagicales bacterium]|nr:hypothetical protein [Candidatus Nanopelagicales bacterium]
MARTSPLTLSTKAASLLSAALRHVRDAEHLLDEAAGYTSPDQAYHLAGFGPECARKAALSLRWLDQALGHGVEGASGEVLDLALALDPLARRYDPLGSAASRAALAGWRVDVRYERTGTRQRADAEALCRDAREAVDAVVIALWADGRMPEKVQPW